MTWIREGRAAGTRPIPAAVPRAGHYRLRDRAHGAVQRDDPADTDQPRLPLGVSFDGVAPLAKAVRSLREIPTSGARLDPYRRPLLFASRPHLPCPTARARFGSNDDRHLQPRSEAERGPDPYGWLAEASPCGLGASAQCRRLARAGYVDPPMFVAPRQDDEGGGAHGQLTVPAHLTPLPAALRQCRRRGFILDTKDFPNSRGDHASTRLRTLVPQDLVAKAD